MLTPRPHVAIFPAGYEPFRMSGREFLRVEPMSISSAENFIRNASEQVSQRDINDSLMKALAELARELKRLDNDVHRVRREVQVGRRF